MHSEQYHPWEQLRRTARPTGASSQQSGQTSTFLLSRIACGLVFGVKESLLVLERELRGAGDVALLGRAGEALDGIALPSAVVTEDGCASSTAASLLLRVGVAGGRAGVAISDLSSAEVASHADRGGGERDRGDSSAP